MNFLTLLDAGMVPNLLSKDDMQKLDSRYSRSRVQEFKSSRYSRINIGLRFTMSIRTAETAINMTIDDW